MQTDEPSTQPKAHLYVESEVQTDEPSTRPKNHSYVESEVQTDELSTRLKLRIFKDGESQTAVQETSEDLIPPAKVPRLDYFAADALSVDHESDVVFTPMLAHFQDFTDDVAPQQVYFNHNKLI